MRLSWVGVVLFAVSLAFTSGAKAQVQVDRDGVSIGNGRIVVDEDGVRIRQDDNEVVVDSDGVSAARDSGAYGTTGDSTGRKFINVNMPRSNLSNQSLRKAVFQASDFRGANISDSDLTGAKLQSSKFGGTNFSDSLLVDALLQSGSFRGANFRGANLRDAKLQAADFSGANFSNACLVNALVQNADLSGANFRNAILVGADFSGSSLSRANTSGAVFDGPATCPGDATRTPYELTRAEVTGAAEIERALSAGEDASIDLTVNFPHDSADIEGKAHVQIYEIANALKSDALSGMRIRIEGHTDSTGEEDYNMDLSYRRALSVLRALAEEYDVDRSRLQVQGFGEGQPVASNASEAGRALNRRVTLVNLGSGN